MRSLCAAGLAATILSAWGSEARPAGVSDDPHCRELIELIRAKVEMLEEQREQYSEGSQEYLAVLYRQKLLVWNAEYVHHTSWTTTATCDDLVAYIEQLSGWH